jgi:hypothetical protein
MKITKQKIKEAIFEALSEQDTQTDASGAPILKTGAKSTSQRATDALKRIKGAGEELTGTEKNLVDQFEKFLSDLGATPGVDLLKHRSLLQRILVLLQKTANPTSGAPPQANNDQAMSEGCGDMPAQHSQAAPSGCADDHEASMAKSDLYKAANYASELEQMIHDGEELEGWVQAKITKATDYLSSVKHYLEYEKIKGQQ